MDYGKVNAATKYDSHQIPQMEECIEFLEKTAVFSTLDANSGYLHVVLKETDRDKTSFTSYHGLYCFVGLPLSLGMPQEPFSARWMSACLQFNDNMSWYISRTQSLSCAYHAATLNM